MTMLVDKKDSGQRWWSEMWLETVARKGNLEMEAKGGLIRWLNAVGYNGWR
jgi:hypothetical protein